MIEVQSNLAELPKLYIDVDRQMRFAASVALNRTADTVRKAINSEMQSSFDRPTPYTLRALRVRRSDRNTLTAHVDFKDAGAAGKGTPADRYLSPQVYGGGRSRKRSERALEAAGMSAGKYMVPGAGATLDQYGNVSRGQIVQLLSYLQAFGEHGYRANATDRSRKRLAKLGRSDGGYKKIGGVQYFVSRGKGTVTNGRRQPLAAGVWRKTGVHGVDVHPVLLFVDAPTYQPRLSFYEVAEDTFDQHFDGEYETALEAAMRSAR